MVRDAFGRYRVVERIGAGGMGVVYRARDTQLDRDAALKVLAPSILADPAAQQRFQKEARALSRLNHPHVCTVYDIGEEHGQTYIAMEFVEGQPLNRLIAGHRLSPQEVLRCASQIAGALTHAHSHGVIHRDVKSSNVMVRPDGCVKLLDFGLAALHSQAANPDSTQSLSNTAASGMLVGTLAYLSPESLRGRAPDELSDCWALGVVLYEMLAGRLPFQHESPTATIAAILDDSPQSIELVREDIPSGVSDILTRALAKDPGARYSSAAEFEDALAATHQSLLTPGSTPRPALPVRRSRTAVTVVVAVLLLALLGYWLWQRNSNRRWLAAEALPQLERLIETENWSSAFALASLAESRAGHDPKLEAIWPRLSRDVAIRTDPSGAHITVKPFKDTDGRWMDLGAAPLVHARVPRGYLRWRIALAGHQTLEFAPILAEADFKGGLSFRLETPESLPANMVRVPGGEFWLRLTGLDHYQNVRMDEYFIDRYEVTNRQFKKFVDAGGYQTSQFWKQPFVKDGRTLPWQEAMDVFRDATSRPGPATWEAGAFASQAADLPVSGVSWYEAAAYAEFAGKSLPTVFHWGKAAGIVVNTSVVPLSNFGGVGVAPVGRHPGLGPYGTFDMAGNVKEWCWNESAAGSNRRYILGGAFDEPIYMFHDPDSQDAFLRRPSFGFRCVKYHSQPPSPILEPVQDPKRDFTTVKPVSDEVFAAYRRFYAYDPADLAPKVESTDETPEHWRTLKVTFSAAYGNQRMTAFLFLPKRTPPPYQPVLYYPTSNALRERSSATLELSNFDYVLLSGRAVIYPILQSTYERGDGMISDRPNMTSRYRDHVIQWTNDCRRALDYLETRADIHHSGATYIGSSWGAMMGSIVAGIDHRFRAVILMRGGLLQQATVPEVDAINFAPRVQAPTLMLNGRYDYVFPLDAVQIPLYKALGAPKTQKRHVLFEAGHSVPRHEMIKDVLDWLDRYMGPVPTH